MLVNKVFMMKQTYQKKALRFLRELIAIVGGVGWGGKPCAG